MYARDRKDSTQDNSDDEYPQNQKNYDYYFSSPAMQTHKSYN